MKINISKKDVIWSYIGILMSMGANLMMLPFIVYFLDDNLFGLWYIFVSIGTIATLFDCGFAVTFARNITYCWSGANELKKENVAFVENREPDFYLMKKVLYTCRWIYLLISSAALLLLLTAGTAYVCYVSREIPGISHIIAWLIYAVAAFLNLYYGYFASFLRGVGAVDAANKNTVIARSVQFVLTVVLLVLGTGLIGACIAYLAYGTIFRMLGKYKFFHYCGIGEKLDSVSAKFGLRDVKELFFVVWHNAWRDGAISICNYFCNQASILICSMYLTLTETGAYSLGVQIASAIAAIAGTLYAAYQPALQEAYINKNRKKMQVIMSVIVVAFVGLFILGVFGVLIVGIPLLRLIKPEIVVSVPVLLGLCMYQFILSFRNCYTSYFSCTNRIPYMSGFIVSAIFCIGLSFIFLGTFQAGIFGLILAQIISQAVYNVWAWPMKAHKELELTFSEMVTVGTYEIMKSVKGVLAERWKVICQR